MLEFVDLLLSVPISFIFMQFLQKLGEIISWWQSSLGLSPPYLLNPGSATGLIGNFAGSRRKNVTLLTSLTQNKKHGARGGSRIS